MKTQNSFTNNYIIQGENLVGKKYYVLWSEFKGTKSQTEILEDADKELSKIVSGNGFIPDALSLSINDDYMVRYSFYDTLQEAKMTYERWIGMI